MSDLADAIREELRALKSPWLTADEAAAYVKVTEKHFRNVLALQPGFPQPVRKSGLRLLWLRTELDAWLKG